MPMKPQITPTAKRKCLSAILLIAVVALALLCVCAFAESGVEYDLEPITEDIYLLSDPVPQTEKSDINMNVSVPTDPVEVGTNAVCYINCGLSGSTYEYFVAIVEMDDADRVALPQFTTLVAPADYPVFLDQALPTGSTLADVEDVHSMLDGTKVIYKVIMNDGSQRLVMFDVTAGSTLNVKLTVQPLNGVFKDGDEVTLRPSYVVMGEHTQLPEVTFDVAATYDWSINKTSTIQQNGIAATNLGTVSDYAANDTTLTYAIVSDNARSGQTGTVFARTVTIADRVNIQNLDFPAAATDFTCLTEGGASNFYYNGELLYSLDRPDVTIEPVIEDGKLIAIDYTYTRTNTSDPLVDLTDETLIATFHLGNGNFGYSGAGEPAIVNSATQSVETLFPELPADVDTKEITDKGADQAEISKEAYRDAACTVPLAPGDELDLDENIFYKVRVDNHSNQERTFGVYDNGGNNLRIPDRPVNPYNLGEVFDRDGDPVTEEGDIQGRMRSGNLYIWTDITIPAGGHFEGVIQATVNPSLQNLNLDNNVYLFDDTVTLAPGMGSANLNRLCFDRADTHQQVVSDGAPVVGVSLAKRIKSYDSSSGVITYELEFTNSTRYPVVSGAVDTWPSDFIELTEIGNAGNQRYRVLTTDNVTYDSNDYPRNGYASPLAEMRANGQVLDKVTLLNTVVPANGSITVELTGHANGDAPSTITNSATFGSGGGENPVVEASVVLINHNKLAYHATMVGSSLQVGAVWSPIATDGASVGDYVAWEIMAQNVSNDPGVFRVEDYLPAGLAPASGDRVVLIRDSHDGTEIPLGIDTEATTATTLYTNTFALEAGEMAFVRIYTQLTQDAITASLGDNYLATNTARVQAQREKDGDIIYASATEDTASILIHSEIPRYLKISKDFNRSTWWENKSGQYWKQTMHRWNDANGGYSVEKFAYPGSISIFPITLTIDEEKQSDLADDVPIYRVLDTLPVTYEYVALQAFPNTLTNTNKGNFVGSTAKINAGILVGEGSKTLTLDGVTYTYTVHYNTATRELEVVFRDANNNPLILKKGQAVQIIVAARCLKYSALEAETKNVTAVTSDSDVTVNEVQRDLYGREVANSSQPAGIIDVGNGQSAYTCSATAVIGDIDVGIAKKATRFVNANGELVNITDANQPTLGSIIEWELYVVARTPDVNSSTTYQYSRFPIENFSVSDVLPAGFSYNESAAYKDIVYFGSSYDLNSNAITDYNSGLMSNSGTGVVALEKTAQKNGQTLTWNFSGYTQSQHFDGASATTLPATVIRYYTTWSGNTDTWHYGTYRNNAKVTFADDSYINVKDNLLPGVKDTEENSVRTSTVLSIFGVSGTTSRKGVSVSDGEGTTLSETDSLQTMNYVDTVDAPGNARFMLEVTNKSGGAFSKFSVVDFLPQQGDAGVLSSAARGSQFDMQISSTPNFTVKILDKNNVETEVPADQYTVLYGNHTAGTQANTNDFLQADSGSIVWGAYAAGDNAFSLMIKEEFLAEHKIMLDGRVQIYYDARILKKMVGTGEDAQAVWPVAGDIAYNSFGYYYSIINEGGAEANGQAEPAQVGVRVHDATIDITKAPLANISEADAATLPPFSFIVQDTLHRFGELELRPVVGAACYLLDDSGNETETVAYTDAEGRLSVTAGTTWRVHAGYGEYRVVEDVEDPFSLVSVQSDNAYPGDGLANVTDGELAFNSALVELDREEPAVKTKFANTTIADFQIGKTVSGSLGDTVRDYTVMLRAEAVAGANATGDTITGEITGPNRTPGDAANAISITLGQWSRFTLHNGEAIRLDALPLTTALYAAEIVPEDLADAMQVGLDAGGIGVTLSGTEAWNTAIAALRQAHQGDADSEDWEAFAAGRGAIFSISFDPAEAEDELPQLENYLQINNLTDTPAPTGVRRTVWPYVLLLAIAGAGLMLTRKNKRRD